MKARRAEETVMGRKIAALLFIAVLAMGAYDGWRFVSEQRKLRDTTYELARWAAENAGGLSRDEAAAELVDMARPTDVIVYQYGQTDQGIQIWTQTEVTDTIIIGTVSNLVKGMPPREAFRAPFTIRNYREAGIQ